ncbi:sensor histidine kinase [Methylobacterium sp. P31]
MLVSAATAAISLFFPRDPGQAYVGYSAILVTVALWFDAGAAFLTLGLSTVAAAYFLLKGEGFAVADPAEALGLVTFVGCNAAIAAMLGAMRSRQRGIEDMCAALASEKAAKAALLTELSHRIGNDLTMLMSMAELQMLATDHEETKRALTGLVDRMYVVGVVYKRLNVDTAQTVLVDMPSFLSSLCADLTTAHLGMRPISLKIRCEPSSMSAGRAALVGLVLNETVTNALKHAFPDDRSGTINVAFGRDRDAADHMLLTVSDDGAGFDPSAANRTRMGQRLLRSLASQLQGRFTLERAQGSTVARLQFPLEGR